MICLLPDDDPLKNAINPNETWKTVIGLEPVSTADLIAELERRRPKGCPDKCQNLGRQLCGGCHWNWLIGEETGTTKDNFKEAR